MRPHKRDMRQVTGGNPYGDEITGDISSLIEKVSNTFDGFNRLKQVEQVKAGERVTVEYVYDGDDQRTKKTVRSSKDDYAAKVTNYLYDRQYVILETDASDNVAVRYVRGINYIARMDSADKVSYFLFNGHGDVVQTVSESGTVENQYDYDVFGNATLTVEMYANSIRYAGEFFDAEVGLYYLRARYYDPYIGRFISQDSYWGEDNNPLSLNLYTYANNNPIMYVDPTGHSASMIDTIIKQIDYQKEIWQKEEQKKGSGSSEWTETQKRVNEHANYLREELAKLESGNKQVEQLVKDNGNEKAGDWEAYKKDVAETTIDNKIKNGETVSADEVYEYQKLNAAITVAKDLGRDVVSSDNWRVENQLEKDLGFVPDPVKVASVSDYIDPDTKEAAIFTKHFAIGAAKGIRNNAAETWEMIKHPIQTGKAIGTLGKAFLQSYSTHDPTYMLPVYVAIGENIEDGIERWQEGDRYERAEQAGEYIGGGLATIVGSKGLTAVLKEIAIASKITKGLAVTEEVTELIDGVDSDGLRSQVRNIAESKGQGLGSALDHVYTATRSLDDEFPELRGVNPYYVEGAGPGVNTNCVSCANATDARLRLTDNDPYATASPSNGYGTEYDLAPSAPWGFDRNLSLNQVKELMEEAGDGESRVLIIKQGSVDHVINTINRNGQIYFIDSQIGKVVEPSPNLVYELGRK